MQFKEWMNRRIDYIDYDNNPPDNPYALYPDVEDRMPPGLHQKLIYIRTHDNGAFSEWDDSVLERLLGAVKGDAQKLVKIGPDQAFSLADAEDFMAWGGIEM